VTDDWKKILNNLVALFNRFVVKRKDKRGGVEIDSVERGAFSVEEGIFRFFGLSYALSANC
jgi:hypothetical protein